MKELTKKLIESGLVDRMSVRMMERWGQLDPGEPTLMHSSEMANQAFKETLEEFIDELELLVQPEALERKEVQLEPLIEEVYDPTKGA